MRGLGEILDAAIPALRTIGFKRQTYNFNRQRGRFVDVIEFQIGKASTPGHEHFTINAGVFVPELFELVWQKKHFGFAKEPDCAVRGRIGDIIHDDFSGKAPDKWWNLKSDREYTDSLLEVPRVLTAGVLPFLERHNSIEDIHAFLTARGGWQRDYPLVQIYLALAKLELGDQVGAKSVFQTVISGKSDAWVTRAEIVRKAVFDRLL